MNPGEGVSRKEGKGRGKFAAKLLAPALPEPGICLLPTEDSPRLPVTNVQESPPALTQPSAPSQTANNSRRVIESRARVGEENGRRTFRRPGDTTYEHIDVKVLPGVGMRDVDPDYRRLLDRNINNVSDPDNEDWGE